MKFLSLGTLFSLLIFAEADSCGEKKTIRLFSPSKVNLFLRVMGKLPGGFHELSSLFTTTSFGDDMEISILCKDHLDDELVMLSADGTVVPNVGKSNLIIKALDLIREKSGANARFRVVMAKRIPMEAGLGGGSSNSATTLYGANRLLGSPFSELELRQMSSSLGSDVPFFFSSGLALIRGRGDVIHDLSAPLPLRNTPLWVFKPPFGLPTGPVYKELNLSQDAHVSATPDALLDQILSPASHISPPSPSVLTGGRPSWAVNDLQPPASRVDPREAAAISLLQRLFPSGGAWMSGSGSSVIALGSAAEELGGSAQAAAAILNEELPGSRLWAARFIRRRVDGEWYDRKGGVDAEDTRF